jgi:hypothetical protein
MLAPPAGEQVEDRDDHGERRQYQYSVHRVHPVEGLPSAESSYISIPKSTRLGF